jgi:hypothetical protein
MEHYTDAQIGLEFEAYCHRCERDTPHLINGRASHYCVCCFQRRQDALRAKQQKEREVQQAREEEARINPKLF